MAASPHMAEIVAAAGRMAPHGVYLFFKHDTRFQNPLVPEERRALEGSTIPGDPAVREVLDLLLSRLPELDRGIYSPVPIAHGLAEGEAIDDLLERFRYEMIVVDEDQVWWWQKRRVAPRIQSFFTESLRYEPALDLYLFEYRVNPEWWDKCYMECAVSPLVAGALEEELGGARVTLSNGARDTVALETLRLDERERLFAVTGSHGEVMFSESLRFSLFRGLSEDLCSVRIGERSYPLRWPPGDPPPAL